MGGIEQHMNVLCNRLAGDADVTVLVPSRSRRTRRDDGDGVRILRVAEFGRYASVPLCPTMPAGLRRLRPDIVHLHFPNPMGDLAYLASGCRAPLVITYHADIVRQRGLLRPYLPVLRAMFNRADRIIVASGEYMASSPFLRCYHGKCTVIPYGVDLNELALRDGETAAADAVRGGLGSPIVLFVGVLRYYKGLDVLLRAMAKVPHARLVIAGRGRERTGLEALAARLGISGRVTFAGEVPGVRRRVLLHAADVFVLPSIDRSEAFGIAQLEAMACGTPVVSSDLPTGIRLANRDGETGVLVPPGDPDALAGALNRLLDDPALRARLGRAAKARVEALFTAERMAADTLRVYREVLQTARESSPSGGVH